MRSLFQYVMIGVMSIALFGCLPGEDLGSETVRKEQTRQAQVTGMARSLTVVSSQTLSAFTDPANTNSPFIQAAKTGTPLTTQIIDLNTMNGASMGPAANIIAAGYCADNAADLEKSLVVWLTPSDNAPNPKFNEGYSGAVMSKLAGLSDPSTAGVANGGTIQLRNGKTKTLGSCANVFNIPVGAPVMVFADIKAPDTMTEITTRTETTTKACPTGQTGTITETKTIEVSAVGEEKVKDTQTISLCSPIVVANKANITGGTTKLGGQIQSEIDGLTTGDLKTALNAMAEKDCKNNVYTKEIKDEDGNTIGEEVVTGSGYDTCSDDADTLKSISSVKTDPVGSPYYDVSETGTCSITGPETVPSFSVNNIPGVNGIELFGALSAPNAWGPSNGAKYRRKVQKYNITDPSGETKTMTQIIAWEGESLNCSRIEHITFDYRLFEPAWSAMGVDRRNLHLLPNYKIGYKRTASVNGWADPVALKPNEKEYSPWVVEDMDVIWSENYDEDIACPSGLPGTRNYSRQHMLTGYKTVRSTDWVISDTCGTCVQSSETRVSQCPAGQTGAITETRIVNKDNICLENDPWKETSNTCEPCVSAPTTCVNGWGPEQTIMADISRERFNDVGTCTASEGGHSASSKGNVQKCITGTFAYSKGGERGGSLLTGAKGRLCRAEP